MPNGRQLVHRQGRDLVDFALQVIDILRRQPWGVDQDLFLHELFQGNPPADQGTRDFYWEEFKRAKDHSNENFDVAEEGWVWVRARRGLYRGQYFYQAVAEIVNGEARIIIAYPVSAQLLGEKEQDWHTRTRSHMRVRVANIEAKRRVAVQTRNPQLMQEVEQELDDVFIFSTRLAAIYFDTGLTVADLRELVHSRRVPRILHNSIRRTLEACERYQREARALSNIIYRLRQIRAGGGTP